MPLQQILPTWVMLNASDDVSPTGSNDRRTGEAQYGGGLNVGDYFDLTEAEANLHSYEPNGILHAGRYRRVQVHASATAAIVGVGFAGKMVPQLIPELNIVTTPDMTPFMWFRPIVYLNAVTPGNFCFIQELGIANIFFGPGGTSSPPSTNAYVNPANGSWTAATVGPGPYAITFDTTAAAGGLVRAMLINMPVLQG